MLYADFLKREQFSKNELLAAAHGRIIDDPPTSEFARLPAPPFLMFDRIIKLERRGGQGTVIAEQDIQPDAWFFQCHFRGDPVQPGCLGLDAVWQLIGFYGMACGATGSGRALGVGEVEFVGQIRPYDEKVIYEVDIRRFSILKGSGASVAVADARVRVRDEVIYTIKGARVGCFAGLAYDDYPNAESPRARGGIIDREAAARASAEKRP